MNRFRPRTHFGRGDGSGPEVALVGDAVGHVHPMTAIGMTMGFLDAQRARRVGERGRVRQGAPRLHPGAPRERALPLLPARRRRAHRMCAGRCSAPCAPTRASGGGRWMSSRRPIRGGGASARRSCASRRRPSGQTVADSTDRGRLERSAGRALLVRRVDAVAGGTDDAAWARRAGAGEEQLDPPNPPALGAGAHRRAGGAAGGGHAARRRPGRTARPSGSSAARHPPPRAGSAGGALRRRAGRGLSPGRRSRACAPSSRRGWASAWRRG